MKDLSNTQHNDVRNLVIFVVISTLVGALLLRQCLGQSFGERCDHENVFCDLSHTCIDQVCTHSCQRDADCPEASRCVPKGTDDPSDKICDVPNQLEREISESLRETSIKIETEFASTRKRLDVYQALLILMMRRGQSLSSEKFDQQWRSLTPQQREKLSVEELTLLMRDHVASN